MFVGGGGMCFFIARPSWWYHQPVLGGRHSPWTKASKRATLLEKSSSKRSDYFLLRRDHQHKYNVDRCWPTKKKDCKACVQFWIDIVQLTPPPTMTMTTTKYHWSLIVVVSTVKRCMTVSTNRSAKRHGPLWLYPEICHSMPDAQTRTDITIQAGPGSYITKCMALFRDDFGQSLGTHTESAAVQMVRVPRSTGSY